MQSCPSTHLQAAPLAEPAPSRSAAAAEPQQSRRAAAPPLQPRRCSRQGRGGARVRAGGSARLRGGLNTARCSLRFATLGYTLPVQGRFSLAPSPPQLSMLRRTVRAPPPPAPHAPPLPPRVLPRPVLLPAPCGGLKGSLPGQRFVCLVQRAAEGCPVSVRHTNTAKQVRPQANPQMGCRAGGEEGPPVGFKGALVLCVLLLPQPPVDLLPEVTRGVDAGEAGRGRRGASAPVKGQLV